MEKGETGNDRKGVYKQVKRQKMEKVENEGKIKIYIIYQKMETAIKKKKVQQK